MPSLTSLSETSFRANVGAVIINQDGEVLAFQRADDSAAWQFPQGGIEAGEAPRQAVFREIEEETGIKARSLKLLTEHPDWLAYEIPEDKRKGARGQVQKWFLFQLIGHEKEIDLENARETEFSNWKWMPISQLLEEAISFKRPVYEKLQSEFSSFFA